MNSIAQLVLLHNPFQGKKNSQFLPHWEIIKKIKESPYLTASYQTPFFRTSCLAEKPF